MLTLISCCAFWIIFTFKNDVHKSYSFSFKLILSTIMGLLTGTVVVLFLNVIQYTKTTSTLEVNSIPVNTSLYVVPDNKDIITKEVKCTLVEPNLFTFGEKSCKESYILHTTKLKTITKDSSIELTIKE